MITRRMAPVIALRCLLTLGLVASLLSISGHQGARAQYAENPEVANVYGITYFDGLLYGSTMAPPSVDTIYILADQTSFLSLRETIVYFWPLTNQYLADWDSRNELLDSVLEVDGPGGKMEIPLADYVIQYQKDDARSSLRVYLNDDAHPKYDEFVSLSTQYQDALAQYNTDLVVWQQGMDTYLRSTPETIAELPTPEPPPQEPEDLGTMSSDLQRGFPVALPAGNYTIQARNPNGEIIEGSQKSLVVFEEGELAIGFDIIPEQRWTRPERSSESASPIYTSANTTIYVQPFWQSRMGAVYDARMRNPQDLTALPGESTWALHEAALPDHLVVEQDGKVIAEVPLESFVVHQVAGPTLGYTVERFDPVSMESESFQGFELGAELISSNPTIRLVDAEGNTLPGSERVLRSLHPQNIGWLYAGAALPLVAVGLVGVFLLRGSQSQSQELEKE